METFVVGHHYWNRPGGGELVCASAVHSVRGVYSPVIATPIDFDPRAYIDWFGIDITEVPRVYLTRHDPKMLGLYLRLITWLPLKKAIKRYRPQAIFTDVPTYRPVIKYRDGAKIIEYIHFPYEPLFDKRFRGTGLAYGEDPYLMERYGRFPLNLYFKIYATLLPRYMRKNPFEDADLVLTNSRWTAEIAKEIYGETPTVLNPPLPPNTKVQEAPKPFENRGPYVVMVGRISEEKRYHWVIQEVMPKLVREIPDVQLIIVGSARTKTALSYLSRIQELANRSGLGKHVQIKTDVPRDEINNILDSGRVFLHATINEHWGVAVAEAMARGLPVSVHKSGGTWTDLVAYGEYGIGYTDSGEAVDVVAKLLTDRREWIYYSHKSIDRTKDLSLNSFKQKLLKYLNKT